jgi:hypothetical protein
MAQHEAIGVSSCADAGTDGAATDPSALGSAIDALLCDSETLGRLCRLAERRARLPRDSELAREVVWDALGDLLLEDAPGNPAGPLDARLRAAVRRRARQLRRGTRETLFIPLEAAPASALVFEPESYERGGEHFPLDAAELGTRIRQHARGDEAALQLLAMYERGVVRRRDVLRVAGMDPWLYRTARQRLVTYAGVDIFTGDKDVCAWIEEWRSQIPYPREVTAINSNHLKVVIDAIKTLESKRS